MDFGGLAETILGQVMVVLDAPVPFLAALLLTGYLIRRYFSAHYETRLENAKSTIDLQDRKLQEYKDKLDGASPDEAKARLEALEQRIEERFNALAPRRLTDEQRRRMVEILDLFPGNHVIVAYDAAAPDARGLTQSIIGAFNAARWTANMPMVMGIGNPPVSGLALRVPDPANLNDAQNAILRAFQAAGVHINLQMGTRMAGADGRAQEVAEILVTSRMD